MWPMGNTMRWWADPEGLDVHPACKKFGHSWNLEMVCGRLGCGVSYEDTVVEVKGSTKWERSHP